MPLLRSQCREIQATKNYDAVRLGWFAVRAVVSAPPPHIVVAATSSAAPMYADSASDINLVLYILTLGYGWVKQDGSM